jgi:hypothetical protein
MSNMSRLKSIWWRHQELGTIDPRVKHNEEKPEPYAVLPLVIGILILCVGLPILSLPSRLGIIPYDYPPDFLKSSGLLRYLICLLGSFFTFLPWKTPWDLPIPKVVGAGWQVIAAIAFLLMVGLGVTFVRSGWKRAVENKKILKRRNQ